MKGDILAVSTNSHIMRYNDRDRRYKDGELQSRIVTNYISSPLLHVLGQKAAAAYMTRSSFKLGMCPKDMDAPA